MLNNIHVMVRIIYQPIVLRMGDLIIENLVSEAIYDKFYFIVAFVKKSGVYRIQEAMQTFQDNNGEIKGVAGIDSKGTSIQGLQLLLQLTNKLYIYHDVNQSHSFHPKIYIFEKEGENAKIFLGSNNLTSGGMFTNYEIGMEYDFNLQNHDDLTEFNIIKKIFDDYTDIDNSCCKLLDEHILTQLNEENLLEDESISKTMQREAGEHSTHVNNISFGTNTFPPAPTPYRKTLTPNIIEEMQTEEIVVQDEWELKGRLLWKKPKLPASDVLYEKAGTNPTGGLRFIQARWKVMGETIDHTTYFKGLFEDFDWVVEKTKPFVETTNVLFNMMILDRNVGIHSLTIRHKPSGEAGQGNYTTILSWGELGDLIRTSNLLGKDFYLYAPANGQKEPFYIEFKDPSQSFKSIDEFF